MEAKLRYSEDKFSAAGKELLKSGCNLLAQSVKSTLEDAMEMDIKNQVGKVVAGKALIGANFAKNLLDGMLNEGLFSKLIDLIGKKQKIAAQKKEFEEFLPSLVLKIWEHTIVFGESVVLSGFLDNYRARILNNDTDLRNFRNNFERPPKPFVRQPVKEASGYYNPKAALIAFITMTVIGIGVVVYGLGFDPDIDTELYWGTIAGGAVLPLIGVWRWRNSVSGVERAERNEKEYKEEYAQYEKRCAREMEKYEEVLVAYDKVNGYLYDFYDIVRSNISINGEKKDLPCTHKEYLSYYQVLEDYKPCHKRVSAEED